MIVKIFDAVRELPIEEVDLSEYWTVEQAESETGVPRDTIWQHVHRSRKVGSALVGNARLVKRDDVQQVAASRRTKETTQC